MVFSVRLVDGGYLAPGTAVPAGTAIDVTVTFTKPFTRTPVVMVTPYGVTEAGMHNGLVGFLVTARSTTSCTIRILNNSELQVIPSFYWLAVQIPVNVEESSGREVDEETETHTEGE